MCTTLFLQVNLNNETERESEKLQGLFQQISEDMNNTKRIIEDKVDENLLDFNRTMLKSLKEDDEKIVSMKTLIENEKNNRESLGQNVNGRLDSVNQTLTRKLAEIKTKLKGEFMIFFKSDDKLIGRK